jgi:hypothetical protein
MKIISAILILLATAGAVSAAPFLVCDPYPLPAANQPDSFEVTITPLAPFTVPVTTNADGTVQLKYDLGPATTIGAGAHTATAVAVKGGWKSGASNSYPFTKPGLSNPVISIVGQ